MSTKSNAPPRQKGLQGPFTFDQVISWFLQPIMYIGFIVICIAFFSPGHAALLLAPYIILIGIFGLSWMKCSTVDPSDDTAPVKHYGFPVPEKPSRYCTVCRKSSPGLDHHCTWLNTCIAANNYGPFMVMIVSATIQMGFQTIIGLLMVTKWFDDIVDNPDNATPIKFMLWMHNFIGAALTLAYGSLLCFHLYLLYNQIGTYCWLLRGRDERSDISVKKEQEDWKQEWLEKHAETDHVALEIETPMST